MSRSLSRRPLWMGAPALRMPWLRQPRLGLSITHEAVRAILVRGRVVEWSQEVVRPDASTSALDTALAHLFATVPRLGPWRPVVLAALGPSASQMRHLEGLPPLSDPGAVARVVAEGASRFFLKNGVPLLITGVRVTAPGEAWAAACDEPVVTTIVRACRDAHLRLRVVVPTPVALAAALEETGGAHVAHEFTWQDGPVEVQLTANRQVVTRLRRLPSIPLALGEVSGAMPRVGVPLARTLAALGERAWVFADAYGAAVVPKGEPLALKPGHLSVSSMGSARVPRWRLTVAWTACLTAILAALVAPGVSAMHAARTAARELARLASTHRAMVATEQDLARTNAELAQVAAFERGHLPVTGLLTELTAALPEDGAIVALQADSVGGHLVALVPRAAALLGELDSLETIAAPEVVGPVAREVMAARQVATSGGAADDVAQRDTPHELERVTIRFRWPRSRSPSRSP